MPETFHSIGQLAERACAFEVLARKAGNVCPGYEFHDLTVSDFLISAAAIAPILEQAPHQPLGLTILRCIKATRAVVHTNTNLGIVLLLAPLASVPPDEPLWPGIARVLEQTTVEDSQDVFKAIQLAKPAGLGRTGEQDVHAEPTLPLRDVMALAQDRDWIAAQYASEFQLVRHEFVPDLLARLRKCNNLEQAIVEHQIAMLSQFPDSHIARKCGVAEAIGVQDRAMQIPPLDTNEGRSAFRAFDLFLRADHHARNPGTSADLIAATLFITLRAGQIATDLPFPWADHPFDDVIS
jgi:triphosphoribosyl-dephospho-CoA synthase